MTKSRNVGRWPDFTTRFWAKVNKTDTCWLWTGTIRDRRRPDPYGQVSYQGIQQTAHRVAYQLAYGPIPDGLVIDHKCHVRLCVNPDHLQAVTPKQNNENFSHTSSPTASGVRGVYWHNGGWRAQVSHHNILYRSLTYPTIAEAETAAIALRNQLHTNNLADRRAA